MFKEAEKLKIIKALLFRSSPAKVSLIAEILYKIVLIGVRKTINATIPKVLNNIPVVSVVRSINSTFKGSAKASVPLLIINASTEREARISNGCFNKDKISIKLNVLRSVRTKNYYTNSTIIIEVIKTQ